LLPRRLEAVTPNTITSRARLWEELDTITRTGVAFDREEHTVGICAVGAAVRDAFAVIAAITIVTPTQRFEGNEKRFASRLLDARQEIEEFLGAAA
jgi:DNA-binding IclR family transcriptional regulator